MRTATTPIMHFTHVNNLPTIIANGLLSDTLAQASGDLMVEVGEPSIKAARRRRLISVDPRGVVADYVPFYFAPFSPMMDAIRHGKVAQYQDGCDPLVYLVTTVERLLDAGHRLVATDRNARLELAKFEAVVDAEWGDAIDWSLMQAQYWQNTLEEPDRKERRMAECLAHVAVPWDAFTEVVTSTTQVQSEARATISEAGLTTTVNVRPGWYTYGPWDLK